MNCDRDTIERLKDCPEVERWGLSQVVSCYNLTGNSDCGVCTDANLDGMRKALPLLGHFTEAANESAVEQAFLDYF